MIIIMYLFIYFYVIYIYIVVYDGNRNRNNKEMSENVFSRESNPGLLVTGQMPYH